MTGQSRCRFGNRGKETGVHGPGKASVSADRKARIIETALANMVLINGCVYGVEDDAEPECHVDCAGRIGTCRASCCTLAFALTKEEVKAGRVAYSPDRPYYIARDADGYCPHLDRLTLRCTIHDARPLRCRKFSCEGG